jgi:DNA mismatch repair protein MutS
VPAATVRRATAVLAALEQRGALTETAELPLFASTHSAQPQLAPPLPDLANPIVLELAAIDPDKLTPRDALETLYRLKSLLPVHGNGAETTAMG